MATEKGADAPVVKQTLEAFVKEAMFTYGSEVNLDRAIPDYRDGFKPVSRRLLWVGYKIAMNGQVKSARLVGDTMGKFHPHGDASIAGALATQVTSPVNTFDGTGNWGTLIDSPAAMRYTEAQVSAYGKTFVGRNYLPVMDQVWNYDQSEKEPLFLPALLPNLLFNGDTGIGVGTRTVIPSFTPESVLKTMVRMLDGEELTPTDFAKGLKLFEPWGAQVVKSRENFKRLVALMTTPKASVQMTSPLVIDRENKRLTMTSFTPGVRLETLWPPKNSTKPPKYGLIDSIRALPEKPEVLSIKRGFGYNIQARKTMNFVEFDKMVLKIQSMVTSTQKYEINVTERVARPDDSGNYDVGFFTLSVPELMKKWLIYRIKLEKASLAQRVLRCEEAIAFTKLLIYACDNLDTIFKALRTPDPRAYLVKHLKLTPAQADQILDLKVRQLSKLDNDALKLRLKEQIAELKALQGKLKKPKTEVRNFLEMCSGMWALEAHDMGHSHWVLKAPRKEAVSQE